MVVGFTTIYICNQCLSALTLWVRIPFRRGVLRTTLWNKVGQWLAAGRWFSSGTPVSSTNKTDCHGHGITEILLKVVLNTIKPYILLSNTISVSSDGTAYHSGTSEFAPICFTCLSGVRVVRHIVKLNVFTFLVPCWDVHCDFRVRQFLSYQWGN